MIAAARFHRSDRRRDSLLLWFLLFVLVGMALPSGSALAVCINYADYLRWTGRISIPNACYGVAVQGDYAYAAYSSSGNGMRVLDVSDPSSPIAIGNVETAKPTTGVAVSGSYAYLTSALFTQGALDVIDVSDPRIPTTVGSFTTLGEANCVAVVDDHAFVCTTTLEGGLLTVIDVSDPALPTDVGSVVTPGWALACVIGGDYAYVVDFDAGLLVINISDPTSPEIAGIVDTSSGQRDVAISGSYAFVTCQWAGGIDVIDISDPTSPVLITHLDLETSSVARGTVALGDFLFFADNAVGLVVVDISDPPYPKVRGTHHLEFAYDVAAGDDQIYLVGGGMGRIDIFDVSNPVAPPVISSIDTPDFAIDIAAAGRYAYIAGRESGMQVIDISDPSDPIIVADVPTPDAAQAIKVHKDYAYVSTHDAGLQIVDISDPPSAFIAAEVQTEGYVKEVAIRDGFAYVADFYGLRVVNIKDPTAAYVVGGVNTPDEHAGDVAVVGDYAYVPDWDAGLQVIDISDPASPAVVGNINTPGIARGVAAAGNYVYVGDYYDGMPVIDVSDPTNPRYVCTVDTSYRIERIRVFGDFLYCMFDEGVQIVDISKPMSPVIVGQTQDRAYGAAVIGEYAYLAAGYDIGLRVVPAHCDLPTGVAYSVDRSRGLVLHTPSPNPTNGPANLRFDLPRAGHVRATVADPAGRCVRQLLDRGFVAGSHRIAWDGRDDSGRRAASGLYFVRLACDDRVATARILLLSETR